MPMNHTFATEEPSRADVEAITGALLIEFGAPWCGHCQAAQPLLEAAMATHPTLAHLKIEDGPGRPLGRSFRVKLWPTLIFLRNGAEIGRLVRPLDSQAIVEAMDAIDPV